jgi:hypothetical protein
MTAKPRWIAKKALLLLHEQSLSEFGGRAGCAMKASSNPRWRVPRMHMRINLTSQLRSLRLSMRSASPRITRLLMATKERRLYR